MSKSCNLLYQSIYNIIKAHVSMETTMQIGSNICSSFVIILNSKFNKIYDQNQVRIPYSKTISFNS